MILGSLNEVLEGDKTIYESIQQINNSDIKKPSRISSILSTLSHYGMSYEDKVYKNMVAAEADWLYDLEEWNDIFDADTKKALYKEQKSSTTIVKDAKIYPNDPCPCGSGKKYKKCCGKN